MKPRCLLLPTPPRFGAFLMLVTFLGAGGVQAQLTVTAHRPTRNATAATRSVNVALTFSQALDAATAGNLRVFSAEAGGRRAGTASVSGATLTFDPATDFRPGELVRVTVPGSVQGSGGATATPHVYQFTAAATGGAGIFDASLPDMRATDLRALGIAFADVTGDGTLDLLMVNSNGPVGRVEVRAGTGTGTYGAPQAVLVDNNPKELAVGDLDGDGDLEFVTGNVFSPDVSVVRNTGGVLTKVQTLSIGSFVEDVALGDVDADGDLDLVTANRTGNRASISLNDGTGAFGPVRNRNLGANPNRVILGDVDADGDLDLLTANESSSDISLCLNNGVGIFGNATTISLGFDAAGLALGDLDLDGDLDLAAAVRAVNRVEVFTNTGGLFSPLVNFPVTGEPADIALADLDGDGDLDVLTPTDAELVCVRRNNGPGAAFTAAPDVPAGFQAVRVAVADLDNDGDLDFGVSNFGDDNVSIRMNQPGAVSGAGAELRKKREESRVWPNPARGSVWVSGVETSEGVRLLDATGRVVRTATPDSLLTPGSSRLNVAGLPAGVYTVRAGALTRRLVVE